MAAMSWNRLLALLYEWNGRVRSRRSIGLLDRRTIDDLGLTLGQMRFEAQKPFWRA
jgi:uncharacterized protein YjiS (DUF1127 family)